MENINEKKDEEESKPIQKYTDNSSVQDNSSVPFTVMPIATRFTTMPDNNNSSRNVIVPSSGPQAASSVPSSQPTAYPTIAVCPVCGQIVMEIGSAAIYHNQLYHGTCLVYYVQGTVDSTTHKAHSSPSQANQSNSPQIEKSKFVLVVQPVAFQIANYNIFPSPVISIEGEVKDPFRANLIDASTGAIINGGFKGGDVQMILHGSKSAEFTGLKLSRMSNIKKATSHGGQKPKDHEFAIQFSCGTATWTSEKFVIVSSYSQLPPTYKDQRPYKRNKRKGTEEKTEEREKKMRRGKKLKRGKKLRTTVLIQKDP